MLSPSLFILPPRAQPKVAARARVMSRDGCARRTWRPRSPNFFIIGKGKLINEAQRGLFFCCCFFCSCSCSGPVHRVEPVGPVYRPALIASVLPRSSPRSMTPVFPRRRSVVTAPYQDLWNTSDLMGRTFAPSLTLHRAPPPPPSSEPPVQSCGLKFNPQRAVEIGSV